MKTITIRGIDPGLDRVIKSQAKQNSLSVNQWILQMLKKVTGMGKNRCSKSTTIWMLWPAVGARKKQKLFRKTLKSSRESMRISGNETDCD